MGDERLGERAAVAGLEHGRLDLDEAPFVEDAPDRGDGARADERVLPRLVVHQEVEVPLAVALLHVGQPVERVRQRRADAGEELERVDLQGRLPASRLRRRPGDADEVAEVHVDLARALDRAEQLDAPGAIDEVEEDELPHVAARHHAPGEPPLRLGRRPVLERVGFIPDGGDLVAAGKALRGGHGARV